jgi:hypothetical protein
MWRESAVDIAETGVQAAIAVLRKLCRAAEAARGIAPPPARVECRAMAWTHEGLVGEPLIVHAWCVRGSGAMKDS